MRMHKDYWKLMRRWPLRAIGSAAEYDRAAELVDELAVKGEEELSAGEGAYLDALCELVEAYDREHYAMPLVHLPVSRRVEALLQEQGMSASALGRKLGNRSLGWAIVRGKRRLTWRMVQQLSDEFKVPADYFRD
jgi:HTH-type transcriptional regulator / antitoxin HigA